MNRRNFITITGAAILTMSVSGWTSLKGAPKMYGLISKIKSVPGKRDTLIAILLQGTKNMPGCMSYIVARDLTDADTIWVTEVWANAASHKASISLPSVRQAMLRGKPLIAGFGERIETQPVGGEDL